jgi:hypothetical protein
MPVLDTLYWVLDDPVRISPRYQNVAEYARICDTEVIATTFFEMERAIERCYRDSSDSEKRDGIAWYPLINETCVQLANEFGVPLQTVAYVCAALSPRIHWLNCLDATRAILAQDSEFRYAGYRRQWEAAKTCVRENVLPGGQKVTRFAENILLNPSVVTVDTHAMSIALDHRIENQNVASVTASVYLTIEAAYLSTAKRLGLLGYELQAITWIAWRNRHAVAWNKESQFYVPADAESVPF